MADAALSSGPLRGVVSVHPLNANLVVGPYVVPPRGAVYARRPYHPNDPPPVDLETLPSKKQVEKAWEALEGYLTGIEKVRQYRSGQEITSICDHWSTRGEIV
jgi:hypothetical protein